MIHKCIVQLIQLPLLMLKLIHQSLSLLSDLHTDPQIFMSCMSLNRLATTQGGCEPQLSQLLNEVAETKWRASRRGAGCVSARMFSDLLTVLEGVMNVIIGNLSEQVTSSFGKSLANAENQVILALTLLDVVCGIGVMTY